MQDSRNPGAVRTRLMAETMALFFAAAVVAGLLAAQGSDLSTPRVVVVWALAATGLVTAAGLLAAADRVPRGVLDLLVALAPVLVAVAVLVPPDPDAALVLAGLMAFAVVDAAYFLPPRPARLNLLAGCVLSNGALLVRGDISPWSVLALDCILLALAVVAQRLFVRASGADTDPLTGLPNRRALDDRLQQLVRGRGTFSVALLDLDHFKQINDTAGHETGDRVLLRVAEEPLALLPPGAVLARQGGDEFALVLPGLAGPDAVTVVWRVCDALAPVGLSCGVAEYAPGESVAQLVRRADGALYAAKAAGRGRVELAGAVGP